MQTYKTQAEALEAARRHARESNTTALLVWTNEGFAVVGPRALRRVLMAGGVLVGDALPVAADSPATGTPPLASGCSG